MTAFREHLAALPPLPPSPLVSVVLAVRNEQDHIRDALAGVREQAWAHERLEILVVDGESTDGTRDIVAEVAATDGRVRLLRNRDRHVAHGLNRGIAAARGAVIVRADGHCRLPATYVRAGVEALRDGDAECVGGPVSTRGRGVIGCAIALAMRSRFGVGGATFRVARRRAIVDHLPFGVWRREVFDWLGPFDESFVRNQDDEFSDRLRRAGGRILMLPEVAVEYWCRSDLRGLARQYHGYGFWKVRGIAKRGGSPASWRHLVPAGLLLATTAGFAVALAMKSPLPGLAVPLLYAAYIAVATAVTWVSSGAPHALLLPVVLPVLHASYGAGFLAAVLVAGSAPADAPTSTPEEERAA